MFTGIIQKVAKVRSIKPASLQSYELEMENPFSSDPDPVKLGESIANNGVCLTVTSVTPEHLRFDLAPETVAVTALSRLKKGSQVNLERALRLSDRLSGHLVQGHVDGTAVVLKISPLSGGCFDLVLELTNSALLRYCIKKGSCTVDGISLTIHEIESQRLSFQIIPHTWSQTALSDLCHGDLVNFEVDLVAKYIERLNHEHKT